MNNTSKNPACKAASGTVITGKWHKESYRILKELGYGANGYVYLASSTSGLVAVKISDNSMSITSEVNVLKHFSKVQEYKLGPSLLDMDDWYRPELGITVPFYVMEYLKGENFIHFITNRGDEWTGILCSQLLMDLNRLHDAGWVFGDLKPDNLLVTGPPPQIRWLDVGGVTVQGRSIKEFTEFFDRGYWGMGSRVAEPTYDLFAVAMVMINTAHPNRFPKEKDGPQQLKRVIQSTSSLKRFEEVLLNALEGKYKTAIDMRRDVVYAMSRASSAMPVEKKKRAQVKQSPPVKQVVPKNHQKRQTSKKKKSKMGFIETIFIFVFLLLAYVFYIYGQLL
ncbi:protein kinase domain-containing protein [Bacillus pinisoli]|uniref:protein kinase domain-containing protein n=1 Tax=Bacillus pinisoli TaxID=2901866 RepID=UPI001FF265C9|nr:protein kinase family protein [Bacillus pinisoli]